ncbi:hypothetical protein HY633_04755 [Candidatus Uhrbacteria bacterium]|nr:hypothetical protein [Candidatus Uhrbacteria bacterium]
MLVITNRTKRRIYIKIQRTRDSSQFIITFYRIAATQMPSLLTPRVNPGKSRGVPAIDDISKVKVQDRIGLRYQFTYQAGGAHLVILEEIGLPQ